MLEKIVVEECWGRVLEGSVGRRVFVERCCGEVLWRRVLGKGVVEKCCREVLVIAAQTRNADKCTVI